MSWIKSKKSLTSLARATQEPGSGTVAHVAIPSLSADAVVLTGVTQALLGCFLRAGRLHPHRLLDLSHAPDVFALAVDEEVTYTAHEAVIQQRRPDLGGKHQTGSVLWKTTEVQVIIQVEDLTLARSLVGRSDRVYRNRTWERRRRQCDLKGKNHKMEQRTFQCSKSRSENIGEVNKKVDTDKNMFN